MKINIKIMFATLMLSVLSVMSYAQLSTASLTNVDRNKHTTIGLEFTPFKVGNVSVGVYGGFESQVVLNFLKAPGQKNPFQNQVATVGPIVNYNFAKYRNLEFALTGGYVGTVKTWEAPKNYAWSAGVSVGFRF